MYKRILLHVLLWVTILIITTGFRLVRFDFGDALQIAIANLSLYLIVFYINYFVIFPKYNDSSRMTKFILLNLMVILFFSVLYIPFEMHFRKEFIEVTRRVIVISLLRNFFSNLLLVSVNTVFLFQEKIKEKELASKQIIEEKLQAELMLLKSQINPHFLFNALNNIYSLSYLKSDKAPEGILLLSKMLRYIIEDCKEEVLPLQSEVEYLETFIAFQDIRTASDIQVNFEQKNIQNDLLISPLLFLPLLENSFKYSKIGEVKDAFINILLETTKDKQIAFEIENSLPERKAGSGAGTGLENLKKRLLLVYPGNHEVRTEENENTFKAYLKINLR